MESNEVKEMSVAIPGDEPMSVVIENKSEEVKVRVIQTNTTVSVSRKLPLETYGSADFFSSAGATFDVSYPEEMSVSEVFDKYIAPIREELSRKNMREVMKDVVYQILIIRAIREGTSPADATRQAKEMLKSLGNTLETLANGY